MSSTVERVRKIAAPVAEELGYELVEIEFLKENNRWFLRFYIDQPEGVSLDDCALFSDKISEQLDNQAETPIKHAYYLEVSSIGAERPLVEEKDFQRAVDKYIHVTLHEAVDGESIYEGTLEEVTDDSIRMSYRVKTRTKEVKIPRELIAKARLAVKL